MLEEHQLNYIHNYFFRNRQVDEEAYILGVKKNAIQVLIPKYGLEGALYLKDFPFVFDEQVII